MLAMCANLFFLVAQEHASEQVVNLEEMALPFPLDILDEGDEDPKPPINRFQAIISGSTLRVVANTGMTARMQVENNTNSEVVVDKMFTTSTISTISTPGCYILYIQSGNTMVVGEFEVQ